MKKPNLNTIIANNLNKTTHVPNKGMSGLPNKKATVPFVSNEGYKNGLPPVGSHYRIPSDTLYNPTPYRIKATPNNGPSKWLEAYDTSNTQFPGADYVDEQHYDMGGYISDKAKATQFGQYAEGGSSWMLTNPNRISTYFPRMANGGGLLSRTVTCSSCGWSWEAVDGGKAPMTCHKCGGMIKMKNGGVTTQTTMPPATQDSVRHLAGQMMDYEARKGSPSGGGLSDWGYHSSQLPESKVPSNWHPPQTKEQAVNMYMQEIGNNPTLGYFNSAMEKGEAGDFLYNTGRDPRVYMLDQYLKSTGQAGLPNRGSYNVDTKTAQWTPELQGSLDQQWNQYSGQINKLPTNTRRQLLNKGRDFYYQNINKQPDGSPNPAYEATWKPRIWESVNTYKKNGGDISIPDLQEGNWLKAYGPGGQTTDGCPPNFYKNAQGKCVPEYNPNFKIPHVASESTSRVFFNPLTGERVNTATTGQTKENLEASTRAMGKTRKRDIEEEKQRVAERKSAVATKDKGTAFTFPTGETKKFEDMTTREQFYVSGKALENRGRFNENEESILDDINPLNWLGSIAGALGTAPYQAKQTNSNTPYVSAVVSPLIQGALEFNPLGGAMKVPSKIAQSMESGLLSKASKINPFAGTFKGESKLPSFLQLNKLDDPSAYYRGIGKQGAEDALKTGVFRQAGVESGTPNFQKVWYATGDKGFERASAFSDGYVAQVPKTSFTDLDFLKNSMGVETRATSKHIPISEGNILKKDWLQGWKKEVAKPTSTQTITRGPINYWEEPNFAARNPKFNPNSYANSVNKFGNTSGNIQPEMMPRSGLVSGGLRQKKEGGVTSPQICYDPKTGKVVPCKPGAHKTWIFTENRDITAPEDELQARGLTRVNAIKNNPFTKEAEDLKNYLIKNQPGEDIEIYPTYKSNKNDRVTTTNRGKTLNEILRGSDAKTRLAFMAHHGSNLFGSPAGNLGKKLQATTYDNCYLGSCYSGDIAASDEFKGLSNFYFRPGYGKGLPWFGVNPNKNSQTGEAGVNTAFFNTTYDIDTLNNLYKQKRSVYDKLMDLYRKNNNSNSKIPIDDKRNPFYKDYKSLSAQLENFESKQRSAQKEFVGNPKKGREYDILNPTNGPHIGTGTRWNTLFLGDNEFDDTPMNNTQNRFRYEDGGALPKAQDGFGCTGKSKCITGSDQKKKDGISGGYIGGMDNIVPLSNAPINYDELTKYVDDQYTDRSSKKQRQAEYAQAAQIYPGLTKNDFYASQAEASRLNSRINDIPTWDKPENQTYDRAWYPYYRSIIQPGVKVNSSQILKFISGQPGGIGGYRQTVESNYGLKKNKYGGWLSQYADEGMEVTTQTTNPSYGKAFEYVVKAGDNLSKISRNTGLSVKQISQANNIFDPNKIRINQKLMLPAVGGNQPAQSYQKWEDIKARQDAMNNLQDNADYSGNEQRISQYYLNRPEESYVVVDKQRGRMNYYKGNKLIKSYEVGVGENLGDAQTVTKVNPKTGKTDWNAGNKSTGAGVYSISNINPASKEYYGLPSFNMKNDQGIEVATSIHGTPASRRVRFGNNNVQDNRMSNGCINGRCEDLPDMFKRFDIGNKVYVLPEDQGNRFQIVDGKPVLRVPSANRAKYNKYVDRTGTSQKGQGVNQTVKTLQYKPTIGYLDKKLFKNDVYQWNDFNDEEEFNKTTKPYFSALVNNKKKIMEATNIPSDVYNEIAKMSFGIYGTESNFGDTHSSVGNFARAIAKLTNSSSSSSPDYKSKATTYGADSDNNSVGLTQIRWSQLNNDEKGALKKLGITSNKDFLDAEKSAIATTAILALRYSQQLTEDQKKDIWKYLPTKWNSRGNYAKRVKNNSKYLTFKQLDDNLKMGGETNGWLTKHL